jgi:ribosomal protection tetracycline resistance protein
VSLYGQVQKEVVQATPAEDSGLDVTFRETTPLCIERPAGTGAAVEFDKKDANPFLATVGLRVDPAPVGSGVDFRLEVELGSMPYVFRAVEDTVRDTLGQGPHGWQVIDKSMSSTGADFRGLTPLVLTGALRRSGTVVYEPMHRFRVEARAPCSRCWPPCGPYRRPPRRGTTPACWRVWFRLTGYMNWSSGFQVSREGELESVSGHYAPVARGTGPSRPRTDHNPLNRREYLLNVTRRVGG